MYEDLLLEEESRGEADSLQVRVLKRGGTGGGIWFEPLVFDRKFGGFMPEEWVAGNRGAWMGLAADAGIFEVGG